MNKILLISCLAIVFALFFGTTVQAKSLESKNDVGCELCQLLVNFAENYANKSKPAIENFLLKDVCTPLGKYSTAYEQLCDEMVLMQLPSIIDQILENEPADVLCAQIKLCPAKVEQPEKECNGELCGICQLVSTEVENWLASNKSIHDLEDKIDNICEDLPDAIAPFCKYLDDRYLPVILHYITENYPPKKVCQMIGFCSDEAKITPKVENDEKLCPLCKATVSYVKEELKNVNATEIKKNVQKACELFKVDNCDKIVSKVDLIIQLVKKGSADLICTQFLKVCPQEEQRNVFSELHQRLISEKNSNHCPICLEVTGYLEDVITSQTTTDELEKLAAKGCAKVGKLETLCNHIAKVVVTDFQSLLRDELPPSKICSKIRMCSSNQEIMRAVTKKTNLDLCSGCKVIVSYADTYLEDKKTEKEIRDFVENRLCDLLPSGYKPMCVAFVEEYEEILVKNLIDSFFNPTVVCSKIGVCDAAKNVIFSNKPIQLN